MYINNNSCIIKTKIYLLRAYVSCVSYVSYVSYVRYVRYAGSDLFSPFGFHAPTYF